MLANGSNSESPRSGRGGSTGATSPDRSPGPTIRRVLMTADSVGGVWQYSLDLATAFRDRGIETTLAVMGPAMEAGQRDDALRRGIDLVEGPFKLEWQESPWEDLLRAGDWLLEIAARVRPQVVHLNGFA